MMVRHGGSARAVIALLNVLPDRLYDIFERSPRTLYERADPSAAPENGP